MATVLRRLFSSGTLAVDLAYDDLSPAPPPYDVLGASCTNPDGIPARLVLTNATGQERSALVPTTQPGVPVVLPAPPQLRMIEEVNYHGVTVLTLSHGATIALELISTASAVSSK
jgi:hypothetical protein